MRMTFGALALAASILPAAAPAPQVQTIYQSPPRQQIGAFAQDAGLVAWFEPNTKTCNRVYLLQIGHGITYHLPAQGPSDRNVTCRWAVPAGAPVSLALASATESGAVLWTLRESGSQALQFDYVLGAGVTDPNERRFQEVAHAQRGAGLWLGGIAGDAGTLVYAVASVAFVDEVACLSTPTVQHACDMHIEGGGIYRVVGRKAPIPVKGTLPAVAVAASGTEIAYVRAAAAATQDGRPLASPTLPVEVRDVESGSVLASVAPSGTPVSIALSPHVLALLQRTSTGLVLGWYDPATGKPLGSTPVPASTAPALSAGDHSIVFRVGRSIRAVDVDTHRIQTVAKAAAMPIGLSADGSRIAWAENVGGRGRIRSVELH